MADQKPTEVDSMNRLRVEAECKVAELKYALLPFVNCNFTYFDGKVLGSDAKLTREDVERARLALGSKYAAKEQGND